MWGDMFSAIYGLVLAGSSGADCTGGGKKYGGQ